MNQQDQYNKDVKALAGTGKEAHKLWKWYDGAVWVIFAIPIPDIDWGHFEIRRLPNADNLILQWQYEADMAITGGKAIELGWWEWFDKEIRQWKRVPMPIDGETWCLTIRRSPSAPDRTEWAREQEDADNKRYHESTLPHLRKEPQPDTHHQVPTPNGFGYVKCTGEDCEICKPEPQPDKCATCRHDYEPKE